MKNLPGMLCGILASLFVATGSGAYEMTTHWRLSNAAWDASNLSKSSTQKAIGFDRLIDVNILTAWQERNHVDLAKVESSCHPRTKMSAAHLLSCGAMYEDLPGWRSLNHFFDPANDDRALTILAPLGARSTYWALQEVRDEPNQRYSYRDARSYFYRALTTPGWANLPGGRNEYWAGMFQSLGHVIHHIQDMAQPQHVRNDAHMDLFDPLFLGQTYGHVNHPSRFERHTGGRRGVAAINQFAPAAVPVYPAHARHFQLPSHFWSNEGVGLAEFTNANFVSIGTNFTYSWSGVPQAHPDYPSPVPTKLPAVSPTQVFTTVPPMIAKFCQYVGIGACQMTFYANSWTDPLTGVAATNTRASTESLFDEDLSVSPPMVRKFTLNQVNFEAAYPFLIERAVAYSAGLLNYFFRGQMEIMPPAEGVYAIVDHHEQRCADACGFRVVKLRVKNTTPGESMTGGELRAVAKFHRNVCYSIDLMGDSSVFAGTGTLCRSPQEDAVVSDPVPLASLSPQEALELRFLFPTAIPINATDLNLQVVFTGTLGLEHGAVAVTTKDIAEPNYVAFTNITDMVYGFADDRFHPFPYGGYVQSDTVRGLSVAFVPNGGPLATLAQLDAPGHAQLAYLADRGRQYLDIQCSSTNYTMGCPLRGDVPVSEFISPPNTSLYGRTVEFTKVRGVYRNLHVDHRLPADFTTYACSVEPELCIQSTMPPFSAGTAVEWTINF